MKKTVKVIVSVTITRREKKRGSREYDEILFFRDQDYMVSHTSKSRWNEIDIGIFTCKIADSIRKAMLGLLKKCTPRILDSCLFPIPVRKKEVEKSQETC